MQLGNFVPFEGSGDLRLQNIAILRQSYTQYVKKIHHRA